jgi:hypothetical protein
VGILGIVAQISCGRQPPSRIRLFFAILKIVKSCAVAVVGSDRQVYLTRVNATSLYDAAAKAIQAWARMWWWEPNSTVTIEAGGDMWRVKSHRIVEWAHNRHSGGGA